jgi:high affinity Mn2+ porin
VKKTVILFILSLACLSVHAQSDAKKNDSIYRNQRFSCHFQFTAIAQHQLPFNDPYRGLHSLASRERMRLSVTSTLFLGARLWKGAELYFNPELSGGRGISGTSGVAGFPNGEVYRIGDPEPVITIARTFLRQTFNLGGGYIYVDDQSNQLKGFTAPSRLVITLGKFSVADMFDNNTYSHDPRSQFLNWAIMGAGAWDYPANTRGYTYGVVAELAKPGWSLKASGAMVPEVANGPYLDMNIGNAHSETIEFDKQFSGKRPGIIRVIGYNTNAHMGNYKEALMQNPAYPPDVTMTRRYGRTKTGFVINAEQELGDNAGAFARLSWNDGQNETWAFTEIDQSANIGLQLKGSGWRRPADKLGIAAVLNGLSDVHKNYLAAGGYGFIIGDGRLNYGLEAILEVYYSARLFSGFYLSPDYEFILNPAYNKDRGPVNVIGIRGHVEL